MLWSKSSRPCDGNLISVADRMKLAPFALLLLAAVFAAAIGLRQRDSTANAAAGPCNPQSADISAEEAQLFGLVQQWRDASLPGQAPLQLSGPLDAAAAMFAEYEASGGLNGGHIDNLGRDWAQRASDCGYPGLEPPTQYYGSGEGIYAVSSSQQLNIGPIQALAGITYPGSGVGIDTPPGYDPAKCAGVAVSRNASGTSVAWVVVIAQWASSQQCPSPVSAQGGGGTTPSPSATASPTSTPTMTPTPSPTPSPTPTPRADGATLTLNPGGWNLVTLPAANSLPNLLYRATGCFSEVYQQQGAIWFDYAPGLPAYANDLTSSNGGAFWIKATAQACGTIHL